MPFLWLLLILITHFLDNNSLKLCKSFIKSLQWSHKFTTFQLEEKMAKAYLIQNREHRVEAGHPWIFRSDIDRVSGAYQDGDIVDVISARGRHLGRGMFNPHSQITIRMLTRHAETID